MKAGHKFLVGAGIIVASVVLLIAQGVRETGVYFLTPSELAAKTSADPSFYDVGLKMGAKVVPGSIRRDPGNRQIDFQGQTDIAADGDVIVAVNGDDLTHTADLADLISLLDPGTTVELGVLRDGERRTIEVELGERPRRLEG